MLRMLKIMKGKLVLSLIIMSILVLTLFQTVSAATSVTLSSPAQTETTVTLSWTKTNDWFFSRYEVYYATSVNGPWTLISTITDASQTSAAFTNFTPNTYYYFRVDDTGSAVGTSPSNVLQVKTQSNPVLSTDAQTATTVSLRWNCNNTYSSLVSFNSYTIQMSTSGANGPWSTVTTITSSSQNTYTITGLSVGMYYLRMYDTVGGGYSSYSNVLPVSLVAVSITPGTATTIMQDQSVQFSASPSGGTGYYNYQWYSNGSPIIGATSSSYTLTPTWGTYNIYVVIHDTQYPTAQATSSTVAVTVNPKPLIVTLTHSYSAVTLGGSITFTTTVSGGTGSYAYSWYVNNVKTSTTTSAFTLNPSQLGSYAVYVTVTDAISSQVASASSSIQTVSFVNPLTVTLGSSATTLMLGGQIQFTATATGGTGSYTYSWYVNNAKQSATTSTFTLTPSQIGSYTVYVTVNDASSTAINAVNSIVISVTASPTPSPVPITPSPTPAPTAVPTQTANPTTSLTTPPTTTPTTPPTAVPTAQPTVSPTSTPYNPTSTPTSKPTENTTTNAPFDSVTLIAIIAVVVVAVVIGGVFLVLKKGKASK
jgi:hypothetical protein